MGRCRSLVVCDAAARMGVLICGGRKGKASGAGDLGCKEAETRMGGGWPGQLGVNGRRAVGKTRDTQQRVDETKKKRR